MKLHLNPTDKTSGFLRKKTSYNLQAELEFDAEERATIKKNKLTNMILVERVTNWRGDTFDVSVGYLMSGFDSAFATPMERKDFIGYLKGACKKLKAHLGRSTETKGPETVEF